MKAINKKLQKPVVKKAKEKTAPKKIKLKQQKPSGENIADVQRLVELLQIHQIELEHQNEELRIVQEELEASRNKYVSLFDFSPIPYFTLNKHGIIKEVNISASKMLGIDRKKLIDRSFTTYIIQDERDIFNTFLKSVYSSMVKHSCELKVVNKEQIVYNVLVEAIELDDPLGNDQKCQVAVIDMTEYKKIEDSQKIISDELTSLNSTKDKIFSIIAHDLRSPFQGLLSSSELLANEVESLSTEEIKLFSQGLNDSLRNLYGFIENLLHWSLMQRNQLEYEPVNLSLFETVDSIIRISNRTAREKNISINNNVDTGIFVNADPVMLQSVIQNIISNAIKFTQKEGRAIISSVEKEDFVEVSVEDFGIGMEPEKLAKLFNFNTIFTTNGTDGEKGTGLGLPLCKEFIERNGGKIWIDSELNKGSKVTLTLRKAS